jgi:2-polyprenyl-3-methyl-5-hydroxy-6-metoxy-1,4-benzoquinol methylase
MIERLKQNALEQMQAYIFNILSRFEKNSKQIEKITTEIPSLLYHKKKKHFLITDDDLGWMAREMICRKLKVHLYQMKPFNSIRLDEIKIGFFDKCLEKYIFEKLNRNFSNECTCWFSKANSMKCIGWMKSGQLSDKQNQIEFVNSLNELGKNYNFEQIIDNLEQDNEGYLFLRSNKISFSDDQVLRLTSKIESKGFKYSLSNQSPIILGYSEKSKTYNVISGIRRLAALRYLQIQKKIKSKIQIPCHLVYHNYSSFSLARPYFEDCKQCDWSGIYDPGTGTHQDFYVQDGVAHMRGKVNKKGGHQKWVRMNSVFKEMVSDKKILDVGAHRGLYCLKAIEYGATSVTALDHSNNHIDILTNFNKKYFFDDFNIIQGDFYDPTIFDKMKKDNYNTAFYFGIIHHLLRIGIQRKILFSFDELLKKISSFVSHGVIIEFAKPTEKNLEAEPLLSYKKKFDRKAFELAMNKYFFKVENLGKCNYISGNRYGRFMYVGLKN